MKVTIKPYTNLEHDEVIKCLQRNFDWMKTRSIKELDYWMNPLWNYNWKNSNLDSAYKYGAVVLNEKNEVVGYLGFIFTLRYSKNKSYKYLSSSYWAIDEGYRFYLFQILKKIFNEVDVVGDFTPIPSVEKVLKTIFKFNTVSTVLYQFLPIPYVLKKHVILSKCGENDLSTFEKCEFQDHEQYNVKSIKVIDIYKNMSMIIFYKVFNARIKERLPVRCIQILKIIGANLLVLYTHEIVWKMQKLEKALLQCDSIFFNGQECIYPFKRIKTVPRQFLNKKNKELDIQPDFLYSELAMLNDNSGKHYLL